MEVYRGKPLYQAFGTDLGSQETKRIEASQARPGFESSLPLTSLGLGPLIEGLSLLCL